MIEQPPRIGSGEPSERAELRIDVEPISVGVGVPGHQTPLLLRLVALIPVTAAIVLAPYLTIPVADAAGYHFWAVLSILLIQIGFAILVTLLLVRNLPDTSRYHRRPERTADRQAPPRSTRR